jgi:hypothetical protein
MGKSAGIGAVTVRRIWQAHGLTPNRMKTFKLSNDPKLAEKFSDVVGLYVDPPAHAVVLVKTRRTRRCCGARRPSSGSPRS